MKWFLLVTLSLTSSGCSIGYYLHSSTNHLKLMSKRTKVSKALKSKTLPQETKDKLLLSLKIKEFVSKKLKLKNNKNYGTFVDIKRPYVTYIVRAAPWDKLENYYWKFPIVGKMPYKGYYRKELAIKESKKFDAGSFDTYVRGASAYSTLGWFKDPILSSMTRMEKHDFVDVLIHEMIHANLYIKNNTDFNERAAVFLASIATKDFFKWNEPNNTDILNQIDNEALDLETFSEFLSIELTALEEWYNKNEITKELKEAKLKELQTIYKTKYQPRLKTPYYSFFSEADLNNAKLLSYKTYLSDLSDFKTLHIKLGSQFDLTFKALKEIEDSKSPLQDLKKLIAR